MFNGPVFCVWPEEEERWVIITKKLTFYFAGKIWSAKPGSIVDGASIPKFAWLIIGSPFIGKYRRASVIHDVYCDNQTRPWQEVHWIFYQMMLADGVEKIKAWTMYQAVYYFGPRW